MKNLFVAIVALFAFVLVGCATGGVELAQVAQPDYPTLVYAYVACVGANVGNTDIRRDCYELAKLEAHRAEETAKAAASAEAARPVYYPGGYGYNNGGYYNNQPSSYSSPPPPGTAYGTNITYRTH